MTREEIEALDIAGKIVEVTLKVEIDIVGGTEMSLWDNNKSSCYFDFSSIIAINPNPAPKLSGGWIARKGANNVWHAHLHDESLLRVSVEGTADCCDGDGRTIPAPIKVAAELLEANGWS